ncbi:hypothetical protein V6B33_06210 [Mangrovibacillus sp. Mu-81]|uniref:hypothetical protein n=1 Tax=Mangrovibacillus sp. Mu-81 TaxID=3121478 RepID=UPI002FE457FD
MMKISKKSTIIFLITLIVLPIIVATFAFFQEESKPITYKGTIKVNLGNFNDDQYSSTAYFKNRILNPEFLQKSGVKIEEEKLTSELSFQPKNEYVLLTLTHENKNELSNTLNSLVSEYVKESNVISEDLLKINYETIERLEMKDTAAAEDQYEVEKFLFDLKQDVALWEKASVLGDVTITEVYPSSKNSAIIAAISTFAIILFAFVTLRVISLKR